MDSAPALESIAGFLATLPDESVEDLLVSYDSLVAVSGPDARPLAALLLRRAAEGATDARRERLLRAAAAVEASQPCALTSDGLTAQQAAAAQTETLEQWEERMARAPDPPSADDPVETEDEDDDEEDEQDEDRESYMEEAPPQLPHLRTTQFFRGMVARVGRDFQDARDRQLRAGTVLRLLRVDASGPECALVFLECNVLLAENAPGHKEIIENASNQWFQPVPSAECLEDLLEEVASRLDAALSEADPEDEDAVERIETLRHDVEECADWLSRPGRRGPVPRSGNGPLAVEVFGGSELAVWIPFLFACVEVIGRAARSAEPESAAYRAFVASMQISYSDWRDGAGYDLEALRQITDNERGAVVETLSGRIASTPNWRDVEALAEIETPAARDALRRALEASDAQTRLRAAEILTEAGEAADLEGVIIEALRESELFGGLSQALDLAAEHPSPRIQETLLELSLSGHREQRVHCAALALYLGGQASEPFDWEHRPFFLRFGEDDRETQVEAYLELCRRLGVEPKLGPDAQTR
jgi:hypothetical protein